MIEAQRQPKPVTVTIEGEDPRDVQAWLSRLQKHAEGRPQISSDITDTVWTTTRLHPSSFVIQPKVV